MNPRYEDVGRTGVRTQSEWVKRGWRLRSELEPGQSLMRPEAEAERLEAELGELKAAVRAMEALPDSSDFGYHLVALYALVSTPTKDGGS